jgi:hypothetical protein
MPTQNRKLKSVLEKKLFAVISEAISKEFLSSKTDLLPIKLAWAELSQ